MEFTQTLHAALEDDLHLSLSRDALARMAAYWERVKNAPLNLTAIRDDESAAILHFADSLAPLAFDLFEQNASVIDVGTGGGFPAVPLCIARGDLKVTALDSTQKKLRFIEENANCPNLSVLHSRAEEAGHGALRETFDVACARAVAPLSVVLEYLAPFVHVGGSVIAYKAAPDEAERKGGAAAAKLLGLREREFFSFSLKNGEEILHRTLCVYEKAKPTPAKYARSQARQKPLS